MHKDHCNTSFAQITESWSRASNDFRNRFSSTPSRGCTGAPAPDRTTCAPGPKASPGGSTARGSWSPAGAIAIVLQLGHCGSCLRRAPPQLLSRQPSLELPANSTSTVGAMLSLTFGGTRRMKSPTTAPASTSFTTPGARPHHALRLKLGGQAVRRRARRTAARQDPDLLPALGACHAAQVDSAHLRVAYVGLAGPK